MKIPVSVMVFIFDLKLKKINIFHRGNFRANFLTQTHLFFAKNNFVIITLIV